MRKDAAIFRVLLIFFIGMFLVERLPMPPKNNIDVKTNEREYTGCQRKSVNFCISASSSAINPMPMPEK